MPAKSEKMFAQSSKSDHRYIGLKALGALVTGTMVGLLVGLYCGREGGTPALCTVVQMVAALSAPTSVLIGSLRWPVEPLSALNISDAPGTCAVYGSEWKVCI